MSKAKVVRAIELRAEVRHIKSCADGTINLTLNIPEDCKEQAKALLDWLGNDARVLIAKHDAQKD